MAAPSFEKAVKKEGKLRMAIAGVPGGGKTWTGLLWACYLAKLEGGKAFGICTENGTMRKYSDEHDFMVCELGQDEADPEPFHPQNYIDAIKAAEKAGAKVILIDSGTHEWTGAGGVLSIASGKFGGWKVASPLHDKFLLALLRSKAHIIITMRSKMEYSSETNDKGKQVVTKLGLNPQQRDGMEYEFDIFGDFDKNNTFTVTKSRCKTVRVGSYERPGVDIIDKLSAWLGSGESEEDRDARLAASRGAADSFRVRFSRVVTVDDLKAIATDIAACSLTPEDRTAIRKDYQNVGAAIKDGSWRPLGAPLVNEDGTVDPHYSAPVSEEVE